MFSCRTSSPTQEVALSPRRALHVKVMSRVLYRTDLAGQFVEPTAGRNAHKELFSKEEKALPPVRECVSWVISTPTSIPIAIWF